MQIFNIDETDVSVVHKLGKVILEVGQIVWSLASAEKHSSYLHIS